MIIVTAGNKYLDIDAYASGIAYAFLLCLQGKDAVFASSATLNGSIPQPILDLGFVVKRDYTLNKGDEFIVVDLSNPEYIDSIVNKEKIIEVIDHHTGFEEYWRGKCSSQIEFIGSVATIIFERYENANLLGKLSKEMCELLICAILDNTLNLKSDITSARDIRAYKKLQKLAGLNKSFDEQYFLSCQKQIDQDVVGSVLRDLKQVNEKLLPPTFGQITLYSKESVLNNLGEIFKHLDSLGGGWVLNLICLKDGKSYIISNQDETKSKLEKLFGQRFYNNTLILPKFKLRKEIIKLAQNFGA